VAESSIASLLVAGLAANRRRLGDRPRGDSL